MTTEIAQVVDGGVSRHAPYFKHPSKSLPRPKSLGELVEGLSEIFKEDDIDVEEVREFMGSYVAKQEDFKEFCHFDTHRYTRNLVDEGNGKYNLLLVCWGEGHGSAIHDHSDSHCFMKMMDGTLTETQYAWPTKRKTQMHVNKETSYSKDQVAYINDSIGLHRVENKSHTEKAVSLHLYSPPYQMCQSFDERSGHKVKCNVTFHTKFGQKCCYRKTQ